MPDSILFTLRFELMIILIIFIFMFMKVMDNAWQNDVLMKIANVLLLVNLAMGFIHFPSTLSSSDDRVLFSGMYHADSLIDTQKNMLNLAMLIISLQSWNWLKSHRHLLEFYILLLSSMLGMFCMISSAHLLVFYLGFELSTIPLAALANFNLLKKQSSEAALKLIMSSAFSSAFLLFGISFIYGSTGALQFGDLAFAVKGNSFQVFAFILFVAGIFFKISVVPFHLWTADVYEGAPVAVTSFLSVVSKGAMFFIFLPLLYAVFSHLADSWYQLLLWLSVLTMLTGNLFALRQENLKRLLAFSSIAQVGFILIGMMGSSQAGWSSVTFFVLVYIFSNLGAFGVVNIVSAVTGKETLTDYRGFYRTNPFLSWSLAIALFSLAGIPPTAGFFGKFFLLLAGAAKGNYVLITIAALNMVISLYYYLRVIRAIFMEEQEQPLSRINLHAFPRIAMIICIAGILITGLVGWFYDHIHSLTPVF